MPTARIWWALDDRQLTTSRFDQKLLNRKMIQKGGVENIHVGFYLSVKWLLGLKCSCMQNEVCYKKYHSACVLSLCIVWIPSNNFRENLHWIFSCFGTTKYLINTIYFSIFFMQQTSWGKVGSLSGLIGLGWPNRWALVWDVITTTDWLSTDSTYYLLCIY